MLLKVKKYQMETLIKLLTVTKIMNTECYTQKERKNIRTLKKKKNFLWPLFMDGVQLPQG